jgi:hypothetical protein
MPNLLNYATPSLTTTVYNNLLYQLLVAVEEDRPAAYYDNANPPNPTIGIGFNLR